MTKRERDRQRSNDNVLLSLGFLLCVYLWLYIWIYSQTGFGG